jgi:hypothetical protein
VEIKQVLSFLSFPSMIKSSFESDLEMDVQKTIDFLRGEINRLERAIASLEKLRDGVTDSSAQKERPGRKSMSAEERQEVSERMKKYWSGRRKKPKV